MGGIPPDWATHAVKRHFDIQLGKMLQSQPSGVYDRSVPYLKALHVLWGYVTTDDLPEMWASPTEICRFGIRSGDLLVCEGGEVGRAGIVDGVPPDCIIQNALHRVRARFSADVRFLQYVLHAVDAAGWFDVLCNRATIAHLTGEKLADLRLPIPSHDKQRSIARFLDRETARVDALIDKKLRQIELLHEKRAALISHAVTRGIDPNAPMKGSGIEWLGDIPADWTIKRIKHVVQIRGGQVDPRIDEYSTMPLVAPNHLESRTGRLLDQQTAQDQGAISGKYMFKGGDVLYSKIRPELAKACIAPADGLCSADMYAMVPRPGHVAHYVLYLLLSDAFTKLAIDESMRVAMPKINREDLGELRVPVAPEREQTQIVEFLSSRTGGIDGLVARVNLSIDRLREYRTALISAAVTGKIDVHEEVA